MIPQLIVVYNRGQYIRLQNLGMVFEIFFERGSEADACSPCYFPIPALKAG